MLLFLVNRELSHFLSPVFITLLESWKGEGE